jgi:hypothetical protein
MALHIPNPKFSDLLDKLFRYQKEVVDIIYDSYEPQNGKTKVLLISAWLDYYINNRIAIVILDNRYNDLRQLVERIEDFNKTTSQPFIHNDNIYIFLNNEHRLLEIISLVKYLHYHNRNVTILIDESDCNVKSCLETTNKIRENLTRDILKLLTNNDRVIYISATSFAVINSPHRNQRNVRYVHIPDDLYEGLEYRGLYHPKLEVVTTDCLQHVYNRVHLGYGYDESYIQEFFEYYHDFVNNPICDQQPNICLFNVFDKNIDKHRIQSFIESNFSLGNITFAIYTGDGITEIVVSDGIKSIKNFDMYIGDYLQQYKDQGRMDPVMIFATRMASRSQTFRPKDNTWKLTHMFLYHKPRSNWEYRLQSLRCNGQYRPQDPPTRMYISTKDYYTLLLIRYNKKLLSQKLDLYKDIKPRNLITTVPILSITSGMDRISRRENHDFSVKPCRDMVYQCNDIEFICKECIIYR